MMAAAQPFISGAISKTINMPHDATVEDCRKAYELSLEAWLKANALYRDGSKLTQPLVGDGARRRPWPPTTTSPSCRRRASADDRRAHCRTDRRALCSAGRERLPAAAQGYTQKAIVGGHKVYLRTGEYEDGAARRDLHRHAQGRRRLPQPDELLRHRHLARPAARRAARGVRRRLRLHPLRAERHGRGQPAHQDVDVDHRLHLPRAGDHLSRAAPTSPMSSRRTCAPTASAAARSRTACRPPAGMPRRLRPTP